MDGITYRARDRWKTGKNFWSENS